jgi:hypothetical protein
MSLNFVAIIVASVVQFVIGAVWYMPLFGKLWAKIHGFDMLSPEAQKESQKGMAPLLFAQFIVTVVTTVVLAMFLPVLPLEWNPYGIAGFFWLGFVVPTQVSAVLFGGTKSKWMVTKILISTGGALACLLAATFVLTHM